MFPIISGTATRLVAGRTGGRIARNSNEMVPQNQGENSSRRGIVSSKGVTIRLGLSRDGWAPKMGEHGVKYMGCRHRQLGTNSGCQADE